MSKRIEVNDLNVYYGKFRAVEGVSLTIEPRSVTAFIGPSGCGKSTFIRTLNRMHEVIPGAYVEGEVLIDGNNLYDPSVDPVNVRRQVGMVFQRPNPFPTMSIRDNVLAFLRARGVEVGTGRILMAANARAFGYCFNPISVFWCWDESGALAATVVEVHNTYGDRHAYLVHPDEQGRATTPKAMYVSPFHGTDGTYDLTVPVPSDKLHIVVELTTDDGDRFSASLVGERSTTTARRAAPAALRGSLLIRAHGIWLWLRRLPVRQRPAHAQADVQKEEAR